MVFSYAASIVLISLALYGIVRILSDTWEWIFDERITQVSSYSFFIVVKNLDQEIEYLMRLFIEKVARTDLDYDMVIVDRNSCDLTPGILSRLAEEFADIRLVTITNDTDSPHMLLPLCRGEIICLLDLSSRLPPADFASAICSLLPAAGSLFPSSR